MGQTRDFRLNTVNTTNPARELFAINGLRFLAATWILLFHASINFGSLRIASVMQPLLDQGVLAMTLFFMLSGFILSYRYTNLATSGAIIEYLSGRIARLYPVYLFIGLTTLWQIVEQFGYHFGVVPFVLLTIFLFVLCLQAWFPNLFGIWNFDGSWSLSVEAFFYSLFPKLRQSVQQLNDRSLRLITCLLPLSMALVSLGLYFSETQSPNNSIMYYVLPIFRLPEFIFGICGYTLFVERNLNRRFLSYISISIFPLLLGAIYWRDLPGLIEWGAPASIVFMGVFVCCLSLDTARVVKLVVNYLGRISYCVYLAQFTTIPILRQVGVGWSVEINWLVLIFSTLLLAISSYHLIEVFAYEKTRRIALSIFQKWADVLRAKKLS